MNKAIKSIYIPRIEKKFNAKFIADVFDRNGIAQVSKVYIEPYKSNMKNSIRYNRVYIGIKSWHDTEAAFNFIEYLRNPSREARLVYSDDNWWPVYPTNDTTKLSTKKRVLTIFANELIDYTEAVDDKIENFVQIDAEKTNLLRKTINEFNNEDNLTQLYRTNALQKRQYMLQEMDESAETFNEYLREMYNDREQWYILN